MAFIPKDASWYLAQIVLEITVEGDTRNLVHINYLLVRGRSPDEAYEKAVRLGSEHGTTYLNQHQKQVSILFRGLRNLNVVYENLEDGAELLYEERVGVSEEALSEMIRPREALAVFKPIEASSGPDYGSEDIRQEASNLIRRK